jgi:hypothetical protein
MLSDPRTREMWSGPLVTKPRGRPELLRRKKSSSAKMEQNAVRMWDVTRCILSSKFRG